MFSSFEFAKKRIIVRLIILFFLIMDKLNAVITGVGGYVPEDF